jgi:hypothetical protein
MRRSRQRNVKKSERARQPSFTHYCSQTNDTDTVKQEGRAITNGRQSRSSVCLSTQLWGQVFRLVLLSPSFQFWDRIIGFCVVSEVVSTLVTNSRRSSGRFRLHSREPLLLRIHFLFFSFFCSSRLPETLEWPVFGKNIKSSKFSLCFILRFFSLLLLPLSCSYR